MDENIKVIIYKLYVRCTRLPLLLQTELLKENTPTANLPATVIQAPPLPS